MKERIWLGLFIVSFPCVAIVSTLPPKRFRNEITQWGSRESAAYRDYDFFRRCFGTSEAVVVTWPGCTLADQRIDQVVERLRQDLGAEVKQVGSGRHLYRQLTGPAGLDHDAAIKRLENVALISVGRSTGGDQLTSNVQLTSKVQRTAVGCLLTEMGRRRRSQVVDRLKTILRDCDVDPQRASLAGLGYNLYMMDKEGLQSPFRMVPLIMLLCLGLTWFFVGHLATALFINAMGVFVGCLSFNVVYLANVDMNAIIWPLPTLTMLLSVSASLHFLSYYRKSTPGRIRRSALSESAGESDAGSVGRRRVIARSAVRASARPIFCCTATTAIGLLSLLLSSSGPVRQFGLFGAIAIVIGNGLLLIWFPAFLICFGSAHRSAIRSAIRAGIVGDPQHQDRWAGFAATVNKHRRVITTLCVAAMTVCAAGVPRVQTGSGLDNFFPAGHEVLVDQAEVASACGPLSAIELLLTFENTDPRNDRDRIRGLKLLQQRIVDRSPIQSCVSAATFAPTLDRRRTGVAAVSNRIRLRRLRENLIDEGLLSIDPREDSGTSTWRVSCRYDSLQKINVSDTAATLAKIANQTFHPGGDGVLPGESLQVLATGEFVLFESIDRQFFRELMATYLTAFAAITLVIVAVLRSVRGAVIALLPNLFPAVMVLGLAGLLGFGLDAASLMTASLALGIAVDDTIHFLLWHRESLSKQNLQSGLRDHYGELAKTGCSTTIDPGQLAIVDALRYCGTAMLQTSVILGASVFLYAFCGFLPTVRFGCLLSAMLLAALLGDLVLLPALLSRPSNGSSQS